MPTPVSTNRLGRMPCRQARTYTRAAATRPPATDTAGSAAGEATRPVARASTVAAAAPCPTPMTSGLARGFRVTVCTSAPAIPSAAPTIAPSTMRGTRSSLTTRSYGPECPWTARHTSPGPTKVCPAQAESSITAASRGSSTAATERRCRRREKRPRRTTERPAERGQGESGNGLVVCWSRELLLLPRTRGPVRGTEWMGPEDRWRGPGAVA